MKLSYFRLMNLRLTVFAAALMLGAPAAHAFTVDTQSGNNGDGSAKFADPEDKVQDFANGGTTASQGNFSFHFSGGSSSDSLNPSNGGIPRAMNNPYYLTPQNWGPASGNR